MIPVSFFSSCSASHSEQARWTVPSFAELESWSPSSPDWFAQMIDFNRLIPYFLGFLHPMAPRLYFRLAINLCWLWAGQQLWWDWLLPIHTPPLSLVQLHLNFWCHYWSGTWCKFRSIYERHFYAALPLLFESVLLVRVLILKTVYLKVSF